MPSSNRPTTNRFAAQDVVELMHAVDVRLGPARYGPVVGHVTEAQPHGHGVRDVSPASSERASRAGAPGKMLFPEWVAVAEEIVPRRRPT